MTRLNEPERIEISDPDGLVMRVTREEASVLLAGLNNTVEEGGDMSEALSVLRSQLGEFVDPDENTWRSV